MRNKNPLKLLVLFLALSLFNDVSATRAAPALVKKFAELMKLARETSGSCLPKRPPTSKSSHGESFVSEKTPLTLDKKFNGLMKLAREISGNGLTELRTSPLRDQGARSTYEFEEIVTPTAERIGLARLLRELPHSNRDRLIRDAKDNWDASLKKSDPDLKKQARPANRKIQKMYREYEDLLKFGSSS